MVNKVKSIGSAFLNVSKDSGVSKQDLEKVKKWIAKNKCYISISINADALVTLENSESGYISIIASVNTFKKSDKDRDFYLVPKQNSEAKPVVKKQQVVAEEEDELPFN